VLKSIRKLKKVGADFIIIPSNTPHYAIEKIMAQSELPVLNLIEITVKACLANNYKRLGVLGTEATMCGGLYEKYLEKYGLIAVIPDAEFRKRIDKFIMDEIIPSKVTKATFDLVAADIQNLNCDAVILGCTELLEVYTEQNLKKPTLDTTRLLAIKALDEAWK